MLSERAVATGLLGLALIGVGWAPPAGAEILLEPVVGSLASPVFVTHAGDGTGRLFILEQAGIIRVLPPGSTTPSIFLDIRSLITAGGERGLLGLAFHPEFESNRRFFVNYTRRQDGATVIAEYRASAANPDVADLDEVVFLIVSQPFANHNGGMIAFGPDGTLHIALGDGGSGNDPGNRAQNLEDLLGKILRIDVDNPASVSQRYSSPPDNPFFGPTPGRDEIFAWGLRNPWRFSFDRQTGALLAGDVGQNAREEIDDIVAGGNYGWRVFEGTQCTGLDPASCNPALFIPPIAEYGHTGGRCSVTGGYVYRGSQDSLPDGSYLFADYCTGELFLLEGDQFAVIGNAGGTVSSFGEDEDGELYVVRHDGSVHRIAAVPPCGLTLAPPSLAFEAGGGSGAVNVTVAGGCPWTATTDADWIAITAGSGSGEGTARYDVRPNPGPRPRSGALSIAGQIHSVSQAAPRRCRVALDPGRAVFGAAGGTGSITVASIDGCPWTATSFSPWLVVTSDGDGVGSGVVEYRVEPNPGGGLRRARFRIGDRLVSIRQQ